MEEEKSYIELLTEAYQGEFYGIVMMEAAAAIIADDGRKEACLALRDLEQCVLDMLAPLAAQYGLQAPDAAYLAGARKHGEDLGTGDWKAELRRLGEVVETCIRDYGALEALGPSHDHAHVRLLVEHEVLLGEFVRREVADDPASLDEIRGFLARHAARRTVG